MAQEFVYKVVGLFIVIVVINFLLTWAFLLRKKEGKINSLWFFVPTLLLTFMGLGYFAFPDMQWRFLGISLSDNPSRIILETRCLRCHRLGDQGADFAPNLLEFRRDFTSIKELEVFLRDPAVKAAGMPKQNITGEELREITKTLWQEWEAVDPSQDGEKGLPDKVSRGKDLFNYRCIGCHRIDSKGGVAGPDLSIAIGHYTREELVQFIHEPTANSSGKAMPKVTLREEDIEALVSYLAWEKEKAVLTPGRGSGGRGPAIMEAQGCFRCHSLGGQGGTMGPLLDDVGKKRDKAWLKNFLQSSLKGNPQRTMPAAELTPAEIEALGEYLAGLK
ncbi:MAG: c-type cytochrome [Thermincolia bacterium]